MSATVTSGVQRFEYDAYAHQKAFHESRATHRLLGGAAGPGKTLALLMDDYGCCNSFSPIDAPEVHTLILRRTHPKLAATVITRFLEKFPREVYRDYNETQHIVTWHNGSTTQFGSMQHEHDVWGWQGQWYKIKYDELTEFTFPQWQNISAWNRCPKSKHCTKDGATNPIGIGAQWVEDLFVSKRPCAEMDANQREQYDPKDYGYFPATYLDNPVYAQDQNWIRGLDAYQVAVRDALKFGKWGVAGGYFQGAWDEAENVYPADSVTILPYWRKWLSGDWGFEHNSAIYRHCIDDFGVVRTYGEIVCNRHTPEELGERIGKEWGTDMDGSPIKYEFFSFAHDAFAQRHDTNPIAIRLGAVLKKFGMPEPTCSTKDKRGREQILYDTLKARIRIGEVYNDAAMRTEPVSVAKLQIADSCVHLIRVIPKAPRDEKNREEIAEFLGDDPLQGEGYGLYAWFGAPGAKPFAVTLREELKHIDDPTSRAIHAQKLTSIHAQKEQPTGRLRWMRQL